MYLVSGISFEHIFIGEFHCQHPVPHCAVIPHGSIQFEQGYSPDENRPQIRVSAAEFQIFHKQTVAF